MGQTATKRHVRVTSGSPPITDVTLACPAPSPRGVSVTAALPRPTVWRTSKASNCR
jgi:hypothetical protein